MLRRPALEEGVEGHLVCLDALVLHVGVDLLRKVHFLAANACLDETSVDDQAWPHSFLLHVVQHGQSLLAVSRLPVYLDQDAEGHIARLDSEAAHVLIKHHGYLDLVGLAAAVD